MYLLAATPCNFALWLVANPAQQCLLIERSMDNFPCRLNLCPNATNPLIALGRNVQLSVVVPLHRLFVKLITIFRAAWNIGLTPALLPTLKRRATFTNYVQDYQPPGHVQGLICVVCHCFNWQHRKLEGLLKHNSGCQKTFCRES